MKIWYTNDDTLTPQKICELESRIKAELPDIICITELYPKFSKNELPEAAYSIVGYDMIMTNNGRGIIIYTANHLKVHKIEIEEEFSEHLWVKVNISKDHCILVGTIYRSPNSSSKNDKLCSLLQEVSKIKHDHIIINGDFNMKQINWATREVSGEKNSFQYKLFDTINDTFLCENVKQPTRMRVSDKPSCLDWVLSENPLCISDMMVDAPLGPSDHSLISFNYDCVIEKCGSDEMHSRSFYNCDYDSMREDLATLNWELEFEGLTTQQSWDKFYGKINGLIERHVPKKKYTTSKKIPWYGREIRTLSIKFLENLKLLYSEQYGFRRKYSTYMALLTLMDKLVNALEKKEIVVGIFLDFSKAFDTVDHDILLQKLYHYGIQGCAYSWFESYLTHRTQFVTYNGSKSKKLQIKCGVPQGSILEPLLFLIYINDLHTVCKHSLSILFADDTNLFLSGKNLDDMQTLLNEELTEIDLWLKANKLSLNIKKTHYMLLKKSWCYWKRYLSKNWKWAYHTSQKDKISWCYNWFQFDLERAYIIYLRKNS